MHPTKKIMVYPTRQIDYAHILKIPITKTQHSRQHMLNISDRQSRGGGGGGAPRGGGGASSPQLLGTIHSAWCLTAVGNRCGHKKNIWACAPPPQHLLIQNPTDSTCLQSPTYQAAHAYKTHVSERQHMLTKPNISDRLKMTNTSQKPNIRGKLTMRTDLKCQHITRA